MQGPTHSPKTAEEAGTTALATPVSAPAQVAPSPSNTVHQRRTVTASLTTSQDFREHKSSVVQAKSAFDQSPLSRQAQATFTAFGALARGIPSIKDGSQHQASLDDYTRYWNKEAPGAVLKNLESKIASPEFTVQGRYSDLSKAVSAPGIVAFRDIGSAFQPTRVEAHLRSSAVREYMALNAIAPESDESGNLLIEPVVFEDGEGRRELYGFKNNATGEPMVLRHNGNQLELFKDVDFVIEMNDRGRPVIGRRPNEEGLHKTFPFNAPDIDVPEMIQAMEKEGFRPIWSIPTPRAYLPEGPREKGAPTMAMESLLRVGYGAKAGAIEAGLAAFRGDDSRKEALTNPVDREMADAWQVTAQALQRSGLTNQAVEAILGKHVNGTLRAMVNLEATYLDATQRNGAHRDPVFAIKDALIKQFGINEKTESIGKNQVPIDTIRSILTDRTPESRALGADRDPFGAAGRDQSLSRADQMLHLMERLSALLPEMYAHDSKGDLVRAKVRDGEGEKAVLKDATWPGGAPRFALLPDYEAVLSNGLDLNRAVERAAWHLDLTARTAQLNIELTQARFVMSRGQGRMTNETLEKFKELLLKEANSGPDAGQKLNDAETKWLADMRRVMQDMAPGFNDLLNTYIQGSRALTDGLKYGTKEFERNGYAIGRLMEGTQKTPLNAYPVGTYSMPPQPSKVIILIPDNKEATRFTAFTPKRRVDGDELRSMELQPVARDMSLNQTAEYMRKASTENARLVYLTAPRSEFAAPRDNRGFPILKNDPDEEVKPTRIKSEQAQIAHAARLPLVDLPDVHDGGKRRSFALIGMQVDQQAGPGATAFQPGYYIPMFTLQEDNPSSKVNIIPRTFGGLAIQSDELAFTRTHRSSNAVINTLVNARAAKAVNPDGSPDTAALDAYRKEITPFIRGLYERNGRYEYPDRTFRDGIGAFLTTRTRTVELMAEFRRIEEVTSFQAKVNKHRLAPQSPVYQTMQSAMDANLRKIEASREAGIAGAKWVAAEATRRADKFEGQQVKAFVGLRADGASTHGQNFLLTWPSVQEMMSGPGSLTDLQKRGLLPGRLTTARVDD